MGILTLLHSERPKLYTILAFLNAIGLRNLFCMFAVIIFCSSLQVAALRRGEVLKHFQDFKETILLKFLFSL